MKIEQCGIYEGYLNTFYFNDDFGGYWAKSDWELSQVLWLRKYHPNLAANFLKMKYQREYEAWKKITNYE